MQTTDVESKTPLDIVAGKLASGNDAELARLLGVARSTVSCWRSVDRRRPSLVGSIPQRYHAQIIAIGADRCCEITAQDLVAR